MIKTIGLALKYYIALAIMGSAAFAATNTVWAETDHLIIEKIQCAGNDHATCDTIVGQTTLKEGQLVDDDKIQESKLRLQLSGLFEEADLRLSKGSAVGQTVLTITVKELPRYAVNPTVGVVGTRRSFAEVLEATAADRDLTGHRDPLSIQLKGVNGSSKAYGTDSGGSYVSAPVHFGSVSTRIEYTRPGFFLPKLFLTTGLSYYHDDYYGGFSGPTSSFNYDYHIGAMSGDLSIGYQLGAYSSAIVGYRTRGFFKDSSYSDTASYSDRASWFARFDWNSEDDPNFPKRGFHGQVGVDRFDSYFYQDDFVAAYIINFAGLWHWEFSENNVLSFKLGRFRPINLRLVPVEELGTSVRYTHYFKYRNAGSSLPTFGAYLEAGLADGIEISNVRNSPIYIASASTNLPTIKAGCTFQTSFGVVNLFALYEHQTY